MDLFFFRVIENLDVQCIDFLTNNTLIIRGSLAWKLSSEDIIKNNQKDSEIETETLSNIDVIDTQKRFGRFELLLEELRSTRDGHQRIIDRMDSDEKKFRREFDKISNELAFTKSQLRISVNM